MLRSGIASTSGRTPSIRDGIHPTCLRPGHVPRRYAADLRKQVFALDSSSSASGTAAATVAESMHGFMQEVTVPSGRLIIRPMAREDVQAACVVMTRAFAGTPEEISMADALTYVQGLTDQIPKGIFLVGRLVPSDPSLLPPKGDSRLTATLALSFHPDTMQPCPTLPPPPDTAYLSNMAVDVKLRRQGIARALLAAAESVTRMAGMSAITLHVRQADPAGQALYSSSGYVELARDGAMSQLKGVRPRILMRKDL